MSGGAAPVLIGKNQYVAACNLTNRGDFISTRNPVANLVITMDDTTASRFTGRFQGAMWYDGEIGESCDIISRGGKLFRLTRGLTNILTEITPQLIIHTADDFVVPAPNGTVDVFVTSESAIATGDTIYIDSGQYLVTNRFTNELELKYISGAANATVLAGLSLLDSNRVQITEWRPNPESLELVYMFQAETYAIILGGQHRTIIFDGSSSRQAGFDEIPPGVLGAYGWGRLWIALPDYRQFVAGDIVGGASGTTQNGGRDAILKFTENDFLNEGGTFSVPHNAGPITAMQFLATQDTSLGMGVLLVGTTNAVFSVNAPVDRTTWKNLSYPIQTISLLDYGPEGPRSTIPVNGDMLYRSQDGWRSFITAHRYFDTPGNTPISREISPLLDFDTEPLLFYGSTMLFDNRIMMTFSPSRTPNGIIHRGLAVANLDLLSTMGGKQAPSYEGAYTGLDMFQVYKALINNQERGFAWVNNSGTFELWEFLTDGYYDQYTTVVDGHTTITRTAIQSWIETRADDFDLPWELKKLYMAELYVDDIVDTVTIQVKFKPDQYVAWTNWGPPVTLCANVSQCNPPPNCAVLQMYNTGYKVRLTLPQPPENCAQTGTPINLGFEFQVRIEITGHCQFRRFHTHAKLVPTPMEGSGSCNTQPCVTLTGCETNWFTYTILS